MDPLLAQVPCLLLVTDRSGCVQAASDALTLLVERSQTELVGQSIDTLLSPAGRVFIQTHVWPTLLKTGQLLEGYLTLRSVAGTKTPVMFNVTQGVSGLDALCHWVFFAVTKREQFEAELICARKDAQELSEKLAQVNAALAAANQALEQKAATIEARNDQLDRLSQTDALTQVGNRRALESAFSMWVNAEPAWGSNAHKVGAMLLLDVDHFKQVNDTWGHDEGDRVLIEVARRMQSRVRLNDHISRFGGEEFVVWLPGAKPESVMRVVQDIHAAMGEIRIGHTGKPLTVSMGLVAWRGPECPMELAQWLKLADAAVYEAKRRGRNQTVVAGSGAVSQWIAVRPELCAD